MHKEDAKDKGTLQQSKRANERGNIFFTLFGAVAVVGVVGAGIMATMRGPLSTMVEVQHRAEADAEMSIAGKLVLLEATESLANDGDCDSDGFVEPLEYLDAAPQPTGGGQLPATVGSNKEDPWGVDYGYCAWDAGPTVDDAGCGGASQDRLDGTEDTTETYTVIAVISAGPDKTFQTTCTGGATPSITKTAGSDDIWKTYNYQDATVASAGLWSIKSGTPTTATIDKDLEVTGGAQFSGNLDLSQSASAQLVLGAASLMLPTDATLTTCNAANNNLLRVLVGTQPTDLPIVQICDGDGTNNNWVSATAGANLWQENGAEIYYNADNVGIGLTDPTEALDISGNIKLTGNVDVGGDVELANTNSVVWASGASITEASGALEINANGGTGVELDVDADDITIIADVDITGSTADNTAAALSVNDSTASSLIYVRNDGNVGIGTTSPDQELDVRGTGVFSNRVGIGTTSPSVDLEIQYANTSAIPTTGGLSTQVPLRVFNTDDSGVYSGIGFQTRTTAGATAMIGLAYRSGNAGDLFFRLRNGVSSTSSEIMRLTYDGYVGIGTTTPNDALDVVGDGDFTGSLTAGSTIVAGGTVTAGVTTHGDNAFIIDDGSTAVVFGPAEASCTSAQKLKWTDASGWSCIADLGSGSGSGGGQTLEEILTEGNDAGGLNAQDFGSVGADSYCDAGLSGCVDAADLRDAAEIRGELIKSTIATDTTTTGQVLSWDQGNSYWEAQTLSELGVNDLGLDATISASLCASGYVPISNGTNDWACGDASTIGGTPVMAIDDLTDAGTPDTNIFIGHDGGAVGTGNDYNTALGIGALDSLSTGSADYNVAIGKNAMTTNSEGDNGVAVGANALYSNTNGGSNTAIGESTLYTNTTGGNNVAVGRLALYTQTGADYNVAVGSQAGYYSTAGSNTLIGYKSGMAASGAELTGSDNTFVGYQTGLVNTSGNNNTAVGDDSGKANTTASYNAFFGADSGLSNTIGVSNTFVGAGSGSSNISGANNTFLGRDAGKSNSTSNANVALGFEALYYNTSGASNTVAGYQAGYGVLSSSDVSDNALFGRRAGFALLTGGDDNTLIGSQAGVAVTTGANNVYIGSGAAASATTGTDNIIIGQGIDIDAAGSSDYLNIGNSIYGTLGSAAVGDDGASLTVDGDLNVTGAITSGTFTLNFPIDVEGETDIMDLNTATATFMRHIQADRSIAFGQDAGAALDDVNDATDNVLIGYQAGTAITTGTDNAIFGSSAGVSLTTESANAIFGKDAGQYATADNNTLIGYQAGKAGSGTELTGTDNTFIGYQAGLVNTSGASNTFIGDSAGIAASTGGFNTLLGSGTGASVDTEVSNILIGYGIDTDNTDEYLNIGNALFGDMGDTTSQIDGGADLTVDGDLTVTGAISGGSFDVDKISEDDTSVETVDAGDGYIVFTEDAAEVMRITGGNVGIGTSTPVSGGQGLDIYHASYPQLRWHSSGTGVTTTDGLVIGLANSGDVQFKNYEAKDIIFNVNNTTEALRIKSDGKVGIGTSSPSYALHVVGSLVNTAYLESSGGGSVVRFSDSGTTGTNAMSIGSGGDNLELTTQNGNISFRAATDDTNTTRMTITGATGAVGIGTSTPDASSLLDLTSTSLGFLPPRMTTAQVAAISSPAEGLLVYDTDLSRYKAYQGGGWYQILTNEVSLNIPDDSLDFDKFKDAMALDASTSITADGTEVLSIVNTGTGNSFLVEDEASTDSTPFVIDADGNVAIGNTTASRKLHVKAGAADEPQLRLHSYEQAIGDGDLVAGIEFWADDTNSGANAIGAEIRAEAEGSHDSGDQPTGLAFYTTEDGTNTGVERVRINNAGNVGIGTSSPSTSIEIEALPSALSGLDVLVDLNDTTTMAAGVGGGIAFSGEFRTGGASSARFGAIKGLKTNSTDLDAGGGLGFYTRRDGQNLTQQMLIDEDGNVGIGTSSPSSMLHLDNVSSASNTGLTLTTSGGDHSLSVDSNKLELNSYNRVAISHAGLEVFDSKGGASVIGSGVPSMERGVYITPLAAAYKGMVIRATGSQTANLFEWQANSGTILGAVDASGSLGLATSVPSYLLSLGGDDPRTIGMERESATAGNDLTVLAGGALSGGTDLDGGDLVLSSGTATGDGSSSIVFQTVQIDQGAGTTDRAPATAMTLASNALTIPSGPTSQQPGQTGMQASVAGMIRYDTDEGKFQAYQAGAWQDILTTASGNVTDDSLDFDKFQDQMDLDASTDINAPSGQAYELSITNEGTGNSFLVEDVASDTTPFVIDADGNVGINQSTPAAALDIGSGNIKVTSGSIGINVAPTVPLDVQGNAKIVGNMFFTGNLTNVSSASGGSSFFNSSFATMLRLNDSDGYVSVGTATPNEQLTVGGAISLDEISAPSNTAGYGKLYVKSSDSLLYFKDDGGTEYDLTASGGGASALDDLSDAAYDTSSTYNMFIGHEGGSVGATDLYNIALGQTSMDALNNSGALGNASIGYDSLTANTSGDYNIALGSYALRDNTTASNNVAIGVNTLRTGVASAGNTVVGSGAMFYANDTSTPTDSFNTALGFRAYIGSSTPSSNTGVENTALGSKTMAGATSGSNNIAIGYQTGGSLTSANRNILIGGSNLDTNNTDDYLNIGNAIYGDMGTSTSTGTGDANMTLDGDLTVTDLTISGTCTGCGGGGASALDDLSDAAYDTTTDFNMFIGHEGGSVGANDDYNVAVGQTALDALNNSTGTYNTALGYDAGTSNTSGDENTFIGYYAGGDNSSGIRNTAIGAVAGGSNTTASYNTFVGTYAGFNTTTGGSNVMVGQNAGNANDTGGSNVFVGQNAGSSTDADDNTFVGRQAGNSNTSGFSNTFLGRSAGGNNTSGGYNIIIGADVDNATATTDKYLNIGNTILGDMGTNPTTPGSGDADLTIDGDLTVNNLNYAGAMIDTSDRRLKTDIQALEQQQMLQKIMDINTYSFRMKDDKKGQIEFGVMAQELENIFPELVYTADDEMQTKSVAYLGLIAPMIEAVQALEEERNVLAEQNRQLTESVESIRNDLTAMNMIEPASGGDANNNNMLLNLLMMLCSGILGGVIVMFSGRKQQSK